MFNGQKNGDYGKSLFIINELFGLAAEFEQYYFVVQRFHLPLRYVTLVPLRFLLHYESQPMPSPSPSNPCGSVEGTLKFLCFISPQSKSGGLGCIQTSG